MNCIFLDSIAPEMKQVLLSQKPDDIHVLFWDELAEKDKAEKLAATDALLTATYKVDDTMLRQAPKVKIVQKLGVGTDNIDSTAAAKYGIKVGNVPGGNTNGVAEMTITAKVLQLGVPIVTALHISRMVAVVGTAGILCRYLQPIMEKKPRQS